jgi:zeaxanthin glucosyltransferase
MSRILFVVGSDRGHINPCLGPAAHLQQQGHTVAFYSLYNISEQLKRAGFAFSFSARSEAVPAATASSGKYFAEQVKDREWSRSSLKTAYVDRVAAQVVPLSQVVTDFEPAVLAVDPKVYEGAIVAETRKLPWATLSASLTLVSPDYVKTDLGETVKWLERDREALFKSFNVSCKFRFSDCLSPHLNLCFTTDRLTGNVNVSDVKQIGPSLPPGDRGDECDFPWNKVNDRVPVAYVWLGSRTFWQPGIMARLFEAVKGREIQLICAASKLVDAPELAAPPANVLVVAQAPQLSILPVSRAHITHGGAASVMESIALGIPMLVMPMYDDQAHQSYFLDKCGVGQRLDLARLDPDEIWRALQFILTSPRIQETVESVQLSYKKQDGAMQAARLIERLV